MKKKIFFKILGLSFLISLLIVPLRGGYVSIGTITGFKLSSITGFVIYYVFTFYFLIKAKDKLSFSCILTAIIIGLLALTLPIRIMSFEGTLVSALECLIHIFSIFCGYLFYKSNLYFKILTSILSIICCMWLSTNAYDMWIHKLNFGTFTGNIEVTTTPDFQFTNEKGEMLSLNNFAGKYVVVDFWFTGCGVCFEKFPKVQDLYDKYKGNSIVSIISMNAKIGRDTENEAFETIKERGYSFPVYRLDTGDPILTKLGVNQYPTVLIFDKNGHAIFRGNIENASDYIDKFFKFLYYGNFL